MNAERTAATAIVTHPAPDLDALTSVWLLRRHGRVAFSGVEDCPLAFVSPEALAGEPGGVGAREAAGELLVDLGGGRFDHHPRPGETGAGDQDASAAELVAEHLGVRERPELDKLLRFCARQDLRGESLRSRDPVDHAVALPSIIEGLNRMHPGDGAAVYRAIEPVIDAIVTTERAWFDAVDDARRGHHGEVDGVAVLSMESHSSAAARAGRYVGAQMLVVRYLPAGHVAFSCRRDGPLKRLTFDGLAAHVRRAELLARGEPEPPGLDRPGMLGGWFLHGSLKILNKGSPKAPEVEPTALPLRELHRLAEAAVREHLGGAVGGLDDGGEQGQHDARGGGRRGSRRGKRRGPGRR